MSWAEKPKLSEPLGHRPRAHTQIPEDRLGLETGDRGVRPGAGRGLSEHLDPRLPRKQHGEPAAGQGVLAHDQNPRIPRPLHLDGSLSAPTAAGTPRSARAFLPERTGSSNFFETSERIASSC